MSTEPDQKTIDEIDKIVPAEEPSAENLLVLVPSEGKDGDDDFTINDGPYKPHGPVKPPAAQ